jgi:hypothetical protein
VTLTPGDRVTSASTVRPERYANLTGTVVTTNAGEIGVQFGDGHRVVWFAPSELLVVGHSRSVAPGSPQATKVDSGADAA